MATSSAGRHLQPSYKQHTAMDDRAGVVVDVEIVMGEESDAARMAGRLDQIEATLGQAPGTVTADAGYGIGHVYAEMAARATDPIIPHRPITRRQGSRGYTMDRFKYDQHHGIVRCPRGKILTSRSETPTGRWFRADPASCKTCPCVPPAFPGPPQPAESISQSTMSSPCAPGADASLGPPKTARCTPATAGWSKASTVWPKPSTA